MKKHGRKWLSLLLTGTLVLTFSAGCADQKGGVSLDPREPVTINVWHYYNGAQKTAFDQLINEFNESVGREKGIIVEGVNQGSVSKLTEAIIDSAQNKVGTDPVPNIFAAYADTAYQIDALGLVADLGQYLTDEEIGEYIPAYIDEGRLRADGKLKIFPTAKSTEIFMLNKTDWDRFSSATGASLDALSTIEGLVQTAEAYYNWTDAQTPGLPDDGKAFFGRDAMANYFIIGARQLGCEIFSVDGNQVTFHLDEAVFRKLWDHYYVPYIKGYFTANGRFRSDDAKVGDLIALVGSSTSATYFPTAVNTNDEDSYPIETLVLPAPTFAGGENFAVQQGAGMVVTTSTPQQEYASVVFLKWFTEAERNLRFSSLSGYLPVKKEANDIARLETALSVIDQKDVTENLRASLRVAVDTVNQASLYTNKAFQGGTDARNVLETSLSDKAAADRLAIRDKIGSGVSRAAAVAQYDNDENFQAWFSSLKRALDESIK